MNQQVLHSKHKNFHWTTLQAQVQGQVKNSDPLFAVFQSIEFMGIEIVEKVKILKLGLPSQLTIFMANASLRPIFLEHFNAQGLKNLDVEFVAIPKSHQATDYYGLQFEVETQSSSREEKIPALKNIKMSPPKTLKSLMKEALPAKTETPSIAKKDKIKTVPKNESLTTEKKEVSKPITLETVVKEPTATAKELKIRGGLNQDFTLENFIQSEHSEFALQCMDALIKYEFQRPRQLLIYGEPGLGKTHLLTALGWSLKKHHKVVKLVTGEDFINDFHAHINKKIMGDFRNKYRLKTDVLLIDDIHAIAKNKNAQEELFNLFNFYEQRHKILVFTSDLSIDELVDFEPRMISRFQGGLAAEVHKPDLETRLKILKSKNAKSGFEIDPSILLLIAQNVTQNIRSLEGALYKIGLFKKLKKNPLTADDLEKILHIKNMQKQTLSVEDILEDCAKNAGLKVYELKSQSRKHEIVKARNRAMLRMREELNLPFTEIGRILTKNHSTVMSGIANAKAYEEPISL